MTNLEIDVLRILRVFGPMSNAEVGRRLSVAPSKTYRVINALEQRDMVIHLNHQTWDISETGRDWFVKNGLNEPALFRGEQQ